MSNAPTPDKTSQTISMEDLHAKFSTLGKNELVLDVRSPEEFGAGHVPGSKNIPHPEVTAHLDTLRPYKTVYVHCKGGGRAGKASEALIAAGLTNVVCVSGSGMANWLAAGYPVEKDS